MTEKELSQLYWLNRETEQLQKALKEAEHCDGYHSPTITGMPRGGTAKGVADYAAELADLKVVINLNLHKIQKERMRLERYIGNIEDSEIRLIMRLRHINGMTWYDIAYEIGYTGNDAESTPRKKYKRFLNKTKASGISDRYCERNEIQRVENAY